MYDGLPEKLAALEAELERDPDSAAQREKLLWAYFDAFLSEAHPRRVEHILWFLRHAPRAVECRTPIVNVSAETSPDAYRQIEGEWLRLLAEHPNDHEIARGTALFVAGANRARGTTMLRDFLERVPDAAEAWLDLGRITEAPTERLACLRESSRLGGTNPNLLAWIAATAAKVGNLEVAESAARELLAQVAAVRAEHGDVLDWREGGTALWERALAFAGAPSAARSLTSAIDKANERGHWGHSVLGQVALARGDRPAAVEHLRASGRVGCSPRLSSYGPSVALAAKLCAVGDWESVGEYLRDCARFFDDEQLDEWCAQVEKRELPDFGDERD